MMVDRRKTIVIALDGAEKTLLLEWARAGVLPNTRALFERSTWCAVQNPPLMYAGSVWPSFYTGVSPARHGKYCSWQIKTGTYEFHRVQNYDRRFATLWDVLSAQGKKVAIIDAPKSCVSAKINGVHIVDWATEDFEIELHTWPPELRNAIERQYGHNEVNEIEVASQGIEGIERMRDLLLDRIRAKTRMTEDLLAQDHWDFFFSLFTEVHTAGHVAWHLHDQEHPSFDAGQAERVGDVVRDVYVATDVALGRLLALIDSDTRVIVYSVNGMGADYTGNHLLDDMLMALDRASLSAGRRALTRAADWIDRRVPGRIYDTVYPLQRGVRRALSLPVRDPEFRSAFRVPTNQVAGGIRINLEGREPRGLIRPDEYDEVCEHLKSELMRFVETTSGNSAVRSVMKTHDVYTGEHLDDLPDLLVEWPQDGPLENLNSPTAGVVRKEYDGHRTGDHRPDGILFSLGSGPGKGEIDSIAVTDLARTLAASVGARFTDADGADKSVALGL